MPQNLYIGDYIKILEEFVRILRTTNAHMRMPLHVTLTFMSWTFLNLFERDMPSFVRFEGFRGSNYEECCPLGYENPVHTSQETHYFPATESSRLMLCKI
jgi:hypothetical protein